MHRALFSPCVRDKVLSPSVSGKSDFFFFVISCSYGAAVKLLVLTAYICTALRYSWPEINTGKCYRNLTVISVVDKVCLFS